MKYLATLLLSLLFCLPQLGAEISVSLADSVSCVCEGNPQQASVSIPFKVSNTDDNGSVTLNIVDSTAASVSTNGYRLEYRDSTSTWNVARMVGGHARS